MKMWQFIVVVVAALAAAGCANPFLEKAWPKTSGEISGLPLSDKVTVARDAWGIPHITAASVHDLLVAQGFVHAQDRLWQMESLRRFTDGRLSEIAGEKAIVSDYYARLIGMPFMKDEATAALSPEEAGLLQAYCDGVNAYLFQRGKDLPLEFSSMGFVPEPWTPRDCLSIIPSMSWGLLYTGFAEELLALARGGSFTEAEWNDILPVAPGVSLPGEPFFSTLSTLRLGALNPAMLLWHVQLPKRYAEDSAKKALRALGTAGGGSNCWAVAKSATGLPLLAKDPHLGIALPPVWYFCHLAVPGKLNVAGCSLAGCPGVALGRNEHVAWGNTSTMLDAVDILIFRVDPADPTRYAVGSGYRVMTKEEIHIGLPEGKSVTLPAWRTAQGPVITAVEKGVQAVAVLKWYGTLPSGALEDHVVRGTWSVMNAKTVEELLDAGRHYRYLFQNLLAADDRGSIGWQVLGAIPIRNGYSGRLPADGSAGADWTGFLPFEALPRAENPAGGRLVSANNPPAGWRGTPYSFSWAPPYRFQRIEEVLSTMTAATVADFRALQADVHSLQADRLLPNVLAFTVSDPSAKAAADILRSWDREVAPGSRGAAVYEVFIDQLEAVLLGPRLGDDMSLYVNAKGYGIEDEIFDRPSSTLWDDPTTPVTETPSMAVEKALKATMDFCRARMGRNTERWNWGRLHTYRFVHPGATNRLFAFFLNRGPYPAPGDNNTVNVSWSVPPLGSYDAVTIPSMRMIASLAEPDGLWLAGPLGQSGQAGSRHYDDLMKRYLAGEQVQVPLTPEGVAKVARETLTLTR